MENAHTADELKQMQNLPLEAKILMTKQRIKAWYESWTRFEIHNDKTGKTRFVTMDTREFGAEPALKDGEWIVSAFPGAVYVSFSGGKDSTVLKHIVDSMYTDVPSLFVNTGLEYPEIQRFAMAQKNVITVRPEMRFDEVLKKYGYPIVSKEVAKCVFYARKNGETNIHYMKLFGLLQHNGEKSRFCCDNWQFLYNAPFDASNRCCDVMKKKPAHAYEVQTGRKPIVGTMAQESKLRHQSWMKTGCNAFNGKRPKSQPMSFWTEQDVLHYIKKYNVPICSVYGDIVLDDSAEIDGQINLIDYLGAYEETDRLKTTGCNRTGCIFCCFGCHLEKSPNRFQRLKETHPRQYQYCIGGGEYTEDGKWQPNKEGLGIGKVLDYIGVKY